MTIEKPYFMSNEAWYRFDEENFRYVLTPEATEKARKSYREFYAALESGVEVSYGKRNRR